MSETPEMERDRDDGLSAVYRTVPAEAPPPALDDAIRAAARRAVGARPRATGATLAGRWQMPLSIAAVLVVCASLVALMREEGGELTQTPRADATPSAGRARDVPAVASAVPKVELVPQSTHGANIGLKPPGSAANVQATGADQYSLASRGNAIGIRGPESQENKQRSAEPPAEMAARRVPPSAFSDKTETAAAVAQVAPLAGGANARRETAAETPNAVAETSARQQADSASAVGKLASVVEPAGALHQQPVLTDRLKRDARVEAGPAAQAVVRPAAPAAAPPALINAPARTLEKSAKESTESVLQMATMAPEKWLARIEELRRAGRIDEAKAGLAEFRRRYPDHALPPALRDWAAP